MFMYSSPVVFNTSDLLHINHEHIVYKGGVQDILWVTSHYLYNTITHAHSWQKKSSVAGRGCSTSSVEQDCRRDETTI